MVEPWIGPLEAGDPDAAWDAFLERYRRLLFATIRHYVQDYDDVMEVFTHMCTALRADDLRRLRVYAAERTHRARFSTWLVTVVRHLAVDWFRERDGRRRLPGFATTLPPIQRRIFEHVFLKRRSHAEAYELVCSRDAPGLSFHEFQVELRAVYHAVAAGRRGRLPLELAAPPPPELAVEPAGSAEADGPELLQALDALDPADRLLLNLYVVEDVPAEAVARALGLPNAKAVYNRAYRLLAVLRERLVAAGVRGPDG